MPEEIEALKAFVDKELKLHQERGGKGDVMTIIDFAEFLKVLWPAIEYLDKNTWKSG